MEVNSQVTHLQTNSIQPQESIAETRGTDSFSEPAGAPVMLHFFLG